MPNSAGSNYFINPKEMGKEDRQMHQTSPLRVASSTITDVADNRTADEDKQASDRTSSKSFTSVFKSSLVGRRPSTDQDSTAQRASAATTDGKSGLFPGVRAKAERKVVGLKDYGLNKSFQEKRRAQLASSLHSRRSHGSLYTPPSPGKSVEELEEQVRSHQITNPFYLMYLGNLAALRVMAYYLLTLETICTCFLTVGLTYYWYQAYDESSDWNGGGMDFILLAFAVTSPVAAAIQMAFTRRERALVAIADFRSFAYHLYLAHALWDWPEKGGRAGAKDVDWVEHCDAVLAQLVAIGDELSRFLSLPTTSRSRHRMTKQGRKEAAQTTEVAYFLLESMTTQRLTRLTLYSERIKKIGLPSGEISRLRQYERFISDCIEQLRMVKMYRTPQALRSFARIFTQLLPPFYAPTYAQVAKDLNSLGMGIAFGIITAVGLTALFESLQVLEDPFTAFLALDGIDVREEFEVLHYTQMINTRRLVFPDAPPFPLGRRAALTTKEKQDMVHVIGMPPVQDHHQTHHHRNQSLVSDLGSIDIEASLHDEPTSILISGPAVHGDFEHADMELGAPLLEEDEEMVRQSSALVDDDDDATVTSRRQGARNRALSKPILRFAKSNS